MCCYSFPLSHPNGGYGFILAENDFMVAFIPDNELGLQHEGGLVPEAYAKLLENVNVLIHDAEFLPDEYEQRARGWGHSTYVETVHLALAAGVDELILWHINQDRTDEQAEEMLANSRQIIAEAGSTLRCNLAQTGLVVTG